MADFDTLIRDVVAEEGLRENAEPPIRHRARRGAPSGVAPAVAQVASVGVICLSIGVLAFLAEVILASATLFAFFAMLIIVAS